MAYIIVFPLILIQFLTLLISITIEAIIFQNKLNLSHKKSIEFSASINLLSSIFLWILFCLFKIFAPAPTQLRLMSYLLFSNFYDLPPFEANLNFLLFFVVLFVIVCLVEFKGLDLLQAVLASPNEASDTDQFLVRRLNRALMKTDVSKASVIVLANVCSNSVILLILLLKVLPNYE